MGTQAEIFHLSGQWGVQSPRCAGLADDGLIEFDQHAVVVVDRAALAAVGDGM